MNEKIQFNITYKKILNIDIIFNIINNKINCMQNLNNTINIYNTINIIDKKDNSKKNIENIINITNKLIEELFSINNAITYLLNLNYNQSYNRLISGKSDIYSKSSKKIREYDIFLCNLNNNNLFHIKNIKKFNLELSNLKLNEKLKIEIYIERLKKMIKMVIKEQKLFVNIQLDLINKDNLSNNCCCTIQ